MVNEKNKISGELLYRIELYVKSLGYDSQFLLEQKNDLKTFKSKDSFSWSELDLVLQNLRSYYQFQKKDYFRLGYSKIFASLFIGNSYIIRNLHSLPDFFITLHHSNQKNSVRRHLGGLESEVTYTNLNSIRIRYSIQKEQFLSEELLWCLEGFLNSIPRLYGKRGLKTKIKQTNNDFLIEPEITGGRLTKTIKYFFHKTPIAFIEKDLIDSQIKAYQKEDSLLNELQITKLKLKETQKQLYQQKNATKSRTNFLGQVSHEFRNSLHGILGMNSLLKETLSLPEQDDFSENIQHSTESLLDNIEKVLAFSELENNRIKIKVAPYQPSAICSALYAKHLPIANSKKLSFTFNISSELNGWYLSDTNKVFQMLNQLISNAIKYTNKGSISITAYVENKNLIFETMDTGIGISAKNLTTIFKPLERGFDLETETHSGLRLGLSISKEFAKILNGDISVESVLHKGSLFRLTLPMISVTEPKIETSKTTLELYTKEQKLKVLIVEDNLINQKIIFSMIHSSGHDSIVAKDGLEACEIFLQHKFDIIIMDIIMPVMNGYEATKKIRASSLEGKTIPIIALTANALSKDRDKCIQAGMNDYLTKPIRPSKLLKSIHKWTKTTEEAKF